MCRNKRNNASICERSMLMIKNTPHACEGIIRIRLR